MHEEKQIKLSEVIKSDEIENNGELSARRKKKKGKKLKKKK